jgi:DHA2 family multidrug resistance protein
MNPQTAPALTLRGPTLFIAAFSLALSNFMVVLDTTIANVSVPHIAGSLAISSSQATWIITSYSVAEAICVPWTGVLSARFGAVRTFLVGMIGFALFSMLCGLATSFGMLVLWRVGQGFCGGPIMPLTQTLLLRIFPEEKHGGAMGLWGMTTVTAPILGPILGGVISDGWSWNWIFFINLPVALFCVLAGNGLLRPAETERAKPPIDRVGLLLLVIWIAALQVMLDLGHDRDWFNDLLIVFLAVVAAIGFAVFCVWELTEDHPAVDIRVFRHRGFTASVAALAFTFGTYFSSVVVIPQWLQTSMSYTATWAGYATAWSGVTAVLMSPLIAKVGTRVDPRGLVFFGIVWLGLSTLLRVYWTSGADFWTLAIPQLIQGIGMPFFLVPVIGIGLGAVEPREMASAAGLMSFLRTLAAAVGTSVTTTAWDDQARIARNELVASLHTDATRAALSDQGFTLGQIRSLVEQLVTTESTTLATNHIFLVSAFIFFGTAAIIWLAARPSRALAPGGGH